jgi:uracil-DNA glycosylase family protein
MCFFPAHASNTFALRAVFLPLKRERDKRMSAVELAASEHTLVGLRRAIENCRGCGLWRDATQAVFGEGRARADVMLVGEQPGDKEDLAGHPFVGPAGRVLNDALTEAGIDREQVYVTNAVKHFKFKARGKRRIHDKPNAAEVAACRPWLDAELGVLAPRVLVPLGATAAQALLGRSFRVTRQRGEPLEGTGLADYVVATVHPSSILRAPTDEARRVAKREFVADLAVVAELLG